MPENYWRGLSPVPELLVLPRQGLSEIPVSLHEPRDGDRNFYWQPKIKMPGANAVFAFVDFFQWNRYDYLSMSSVHCKVIECEEIELVGRQALIENQYVGFFVHDTKTDRPSGARTLSTKTGRGN